MREFRIGCGAALLLAGSGCDRGDARPEQGPAVTRSRSQAVEATNVAPTVAAATKPAAATSAEPKAPRALCQGQLDEPGKALPKKPLYTRSAHGLPKLEAEVPVGDGKWTWLNFWAAWCVPCKEEIPRLLGWQQKLGSKLRVAFVSLDDDERQLEQFLGSQPPSGVRSTLWLREGKEREEWLASAGLDVDPELPFHLLIDPSGKVRCVVRGAVEDSDYASLSALVSR